MIHQHHPEAQWMPSLLMVTLHDIFSWLSGTDGKDWFVIHWSGKTFNENISDGVFAAN